MTQHMQRGSHRLRLSSPGSMLSSASVPVLAVGLACGAPAIAQVGPGLTAPPVFQSVDEHGVELLGGRLVRSLDSISIGRGAGSLGYNWSTDSSLQQDILGYITIVADPANAANNKLSVVIGGGTETFTGPASGTTFAQDQGRPSTLTRDIAADTYTYTRSNGSVAIFSKALAAGTPAASTYGLKSLTHPGGQVLNYYYTYTSPRHDVHAVTSSLGYQLRLTRNSTGGVTSVVAFNMHSETCDPAAASCTLTGSWPKLTWNAATGDLTDSTNRSVRMTKTSTQVVITYPSGRTLTYNGANGSTGIFKVTSFTDGKGTWNYEYPSPAGNVTVVRNPDGPTAPHVVVWDMATGLVSTESVTGQYPQTSFTYDSKARVKTVKISDNTGPKSEMRYDYDLRGNLKEVRSVSATPGTPLDIVTTAKFPDTCTALTIKTCNQPEYTLDARNSRTDFMYDDAHGGLTSKTLPPDSNGVRPQIRYSYSQLSANYRNGSGTMIAGPGMYRLTGTSECVAGASCLGTENEVKTTVVYGSNDALLPTSVTRSSGTGSLSATTTLSYTPTGDIKTSDGPLPELVVGANDAVRSYYDAMRRPLGAIGPDPDGNAGTLVRRATRITYDNDGRVSQRDTGTATGQADASLAAMTSLEQQVVTYNAQGRRHMVSAKSGATTYGVVQFDYTNAGSLLCQAQRMNPATFGSLTMSACDPALAGSHGADRITRYTYDPLFRLTAAKTSTGTATEASESKIFDNLGRLASVTDGENNRTTYQYDGHNRLEWIYYPVSTKGANASNTGNSEQFTYDATGNILTRKVRSGAIISYGYDQLNRVISKSTPTLPTIAYTYTLQDRLLTAKDSSNGQGITHTYNAFSQVKTAKTDYQGIDRTLTYAFDLAGRRSRLTWWDGVYVDYLRRPTGEISKIRLNNATDLATYTFDNMGRPTLLVRGNGTTTQFGYDSISRLASFTHDLGGPTTTNDLTVDSFTYNPAGQIRTQTKSNNNYAWTNQVAVNRDYVSNGLNQYSSAANGTVLYSYDLNGNLTGDGATSFTYDVENRLVSSTAGAATKTLGYDPISRFAVYDAGGAKRFIYDGADVTAELNSAGTMSRRFIRGDGVNDIIVEFVGSTPGDVSAPRYHHLDERGSSIAWSDASGNMATIQRFDEYGIPAPTNPGRFQYTGQMWLPEIGVYNYKARMYSPTLGRFLQVDPTGYSDGMNAYAYTKNDPVNATDPFGEEAIRICRMVGVFTPAAESSGQGGMGSTGSWSWGESCYWVEVPDYRPPTPVVYPYNPWVSGSGNTAGNTHAYQTLNKVASTEQCSADEFQDGFEKYIVPYEDTSQPQVSGGNYTASTPLGYPNGPVTAYNIGPNHWRNITHPGHPVHDGSIDRIGFQSGGSWWVATIGRGVNYGWFLARANEVVGTALFNRVDSNLSDHLATSCAEGGG